MSLPPIPPVSVPPRSSSFASMIAEPLLTPSSEGIDADRTRPGDSEIEKNETEQDGRHATVLRGIEALRKMRDEIREGHEPREHEGGSAAKEADEQRKAEDQLEKARRPGQRIRRRHFVGGGKAQELLGAVAEQHQGGYDAQQAQGIGAIFLQRAFHVDLPEIDDGKLLKRRMAHRHSRVITISL